MSFSFKVPLALFVNRHRQFFRLSPFFPPLPVEVVNRHAAFELSLVALTECCKEYSAGLWMTRRVSDAILEIW